MNVKQMKAMKWHKKCMIDAMRDDGIQLSEIDDTLDNIIENLDEQRKRAADPETIRKESYSRGYNDGWMDAAAHFNQRPI